MNHCETIEIQLFALWRMCGERKKIYQAVFEIFEKALKIQNYSKIINVVILRKLSF